MSDQKVTPENAQAALMELELSAAINKAVQKYRIKKGHLSPLLLNSVVLAYKEGMEEATKGLIELNKHLTEIKKSAKVSSDSADKVVTQTEEPKNETGA